MKNAAKIGGAGGGLVRNNMLKYKTQTVNTTASHQMSLLLTKEVNAQSLLRQLVFIGPK